MARWSAPTMGAGDLALPVWFTPASPDYGTSRAHDTRRAGHQKSLGTCRSGRPHRLESQKLSTRMAGASSLC